MSKANMAVPANSSEKTNGVPENLYGWQDQHNQKILFIDPIGVLAGAKEGIEPYSGLTPLWLSLLNQVNALPNCKFNPVAVSQVRQIIDATNARLVVHSDLANGMSVEDMEKTWDALLTNGFQENDFHPDWCVLQMATRLANDHPIKLDARSLGLKENNLNQRLLRIPGWLSFHNASSFAILDCRNSLWWPGWGTPQGAAVCEALMLEVRPYSLGLIPHPNWVRVGNRQEERDVLSSDEAAKAIDLLN